MKPAEVGATGESQVSMLSAMDKVSAMIPAPPAKNDKDEVDNNDDWD